MAAAKSKVTPFYEVRVSYQNRRYCATPAEAAAYMMQKASASEKRALKEAELARIIKGIRVGKDIRIFETTVERLQMWG